MAFPVSPTNGQQANINGITYTYSNVLTAWTVSTSVSNTFVSINVSANVNSGNVLNIGIISSTGNVAGNFFIGNGSQLTGIAASYGNANVVANLAALGTNPVSTTGNVNGGNLLFGSGVASGTGNITGGNVLTGGLISATGTVSGSSHLGAVVSATANITGGNITTAGKVGIGTSSPSSILHVYKVGDGTTPVLFQTDNATGLLYFYNDSNGWSLDTPGDMRFVTSRTASGQPTRMMISTGGNILFGTTSAPNLSGAGSGFINDGESRWQLRMNQSTTDARALQSFNNPNGGVGSISTSGSSTAYNTSSDYRLKENIVPMTGALAKVAQLKPCTYKWKCDGTDGEGFIAHELAEVCPQAVAGTKDAVDADGNLVHQGVDTSFLVATLTAAIQELKAINDSQAATITALTARIVALESK
jgi:hypothetical protein